MLSNSVINEFIEILGNENVITNKENISLAEQTTYPTSEQIELILIPDNIEKLKQCILLAQKHKQPVYTVSQGKNWGYGSRVPVVNNNILIELKKLNKITDYNEKFAYITVEPGVTFDQVFNFLRQKNSELIISTTGSSGDTSLIGNVLERGIGTGLYADRFSHVCGFEVLLPDGSMIATGFEKHENAQVGKLYRWGSGPHLDGLFSQSNLGIVTKMTIWLMKTPPYLSIAFYKITNENISRLIDKLQSLSMEGLLRPTFTIYNDVRVISSVIQYPFAQFDPNQTDSDILMQQIKKNIPMLGNMVGEWNGEISFRSANEEHANIQKKIVEDNFSDLMNDLTVITLSKEEIMQNFSDHYSSTNKNLQQVALKPFLLKKYSGIPDNSAIRQTYWRKRKPIPENLDPDKDKCGIIWICPIIPFHGEDANRAIDLIKNTLKKYHFEPAISLQCMTERCINTIASFCWDREIEAEDKAAVECYEEINNLLSEANYFSYRSTTLSMKKNSNTNQNDRFLSILKNAIDPDNILSPGRYTDGAV